jgi:hypothetical protein
MAVVQKIKVWIPPPVGLWAGLVVFVCVADDEDSKLGFVLRKHSQGPSRAFACAGLRANAVLPSLDV